MIMSPAAHAIRSWRAWLHTEAQKAMDGRPPLTDTPLRLVVTYRMPRPKKYLTPEWENRPVPHIVKPDGDNLRKAVQDALNRVVWSDDCCVCEAYERKRYVMPGEQPGVAVRVEIVDPSTWK